MRPHVIVHNGVSLNGMLTGFEVEMGLYYRLAGLLDRQADMVGSDTILAAPEAAQADDPQETCAPQEGPGSSRLV